ncbi:MAG: hypothetical protein HYX61_08110 [Gammaproteobacteria bacterium]|jgi:hypothetical protein|nr:hypothetical protein [Gammaproteobacteria bacterium]
MLDISYDPQDFTLAEYERLLILAKQRFPFRNYNQYQTTDTFIIWRHDIDMSLEQALLISKIENRYQLSATYFIHLHNPFYNALEKSSTNILTTIIQNGHAVGLHFDVEYYDIDDFNKLKYWLAYEKDLLETLLGQSIDVFSFHNPNEFALDCNAEYYAGMLNCYSNFFKNKIHYCSDSNGYWRYKKLKDVLTDPSVSSLQVLTHPEWWTEEALTPRKKVSQFLERKMKDSLFTYDQLLAKTNRVNIE